MTDSPEVGMERIIKNLEKENATLAAGQCIIPDGLLGDDHGHQYCALKEQMGKMSRCIRLLNSMVLSGENHSDLSKAIVCDALK